MHTLGIPESTQAFQPKTTQQPWVESSDLFPSTDISRHALHMLIINSILWGGEFQDGIALIGDRRGGRDAIEITYSDISLFGGVVWEGEGNINMDPLFVNPVPEVIEGTAAPDFTLQPNSPCIDAGDPESPLDPDGSRADMGYQAFVPEM